MALGVRPCVAATRFIAIDDLCHQQSYSVLTPALRLPVLRPAYAASGWQRHELQPRSLLPSSYVLFTGPRVSVGRQGSTADVELTASGEEHRPVTLFNALLLWKMRGCLTSPTKQLAITCAGKTAGSV